MGFSYRKRVRLGENSWLNISKRGVSGSARFGRLTVNSRGRRTVRILPGLSHRGGCALPVLVVAVALVGAVTVGGRRR